MQDITQQYLNSILPDNPLLSIKQIGVDNNVPIISDIVAQLLMTYVACHKPSSILEIGTGIGYSGLILLHNAPRAKLVSCELQANLADIARSNMVKYNYDAVVLQGDCRDIVPQLRQGLTIQHNSLPDKYDLIFMDGPKSAYMQLLPHFVALMSARGVLICDNVLLHGNVVQQSKPSTMVRNMRQFLLEIHKPPLISSVLPIGDGISITTHK
jgi:predicted O-methyltransferase YrrM